jgi:hypothetical protein
MQNVEHRIKFNSKLGKLEKEQNHVCAGTKCAEN